jgi:hypothetical protein
VFFGIRHSFVHEALDEARRLHVRPLRTSESDQELIEDIRTAWLLVHEAACINADLGVPLSLAG